MDNSNNRSLLIIDDSEMNLAMLSRILNRDYNLHLARNGLEGVEAAVKHLPDVIVLDIVMPKMDGYETIAMLKSLEQTREIPVVFVTGLSKAKDEERGLALGCADYITKPFSAEIVKLRLRNQIRMLDYIRTIEILSKQDQLTGIPNRRNFDDRLTIEWGRAKREKTSISILMIDIDYFKNFNDTYGHLNGDLVLKTVASLITKTLKRTTDIAARWGGEEFIALLPCTDLRGSTIVAEKIREVVERTDFMLQDGRVTNVSISVGVNTRVPTNDCTMDEFIHCADDALYNAKREGRNKVWQYCN